MTFDNYVFRCYRVSNLLTKEGLKSKTLQDYLTDIFFEEYCGIPMKELDFKFLSKGIECEQDSLELISTVRNRFVKKNKIRLSNEFITGEPDILESDTVDDNKCCWDKMSFFFAGVTKNYDWQLEGYAILFDKANKRLTYTLVNTPAHYIEDEKRFLLKKMDAGSQEYINECSKLEILHIHDLQKFQNDYPDFFFHTDLSKWKYDMRPGDRVKSFPVPRQPKEKIKKLYERIAESRKFLNLLTEKFKKL